MIRLTLPREAYWLDLPHGVRLQVDPIDTAREEAVRATALRSVREQEQDGVSPEVRSGRIKQAMATAAARLAVRDWQGVYPAEGDAPVPLTPDGLDQVMAIPSIATAFLAGWYGPLDRLAAEGNASSAAPGGFTAAAPPIAQTAASPVPIAQPS